MELVNEAYRLKPALGGEDGERALAFATATAASLIFPFAPHVASEVWEGVVGGDLWEVPWPEPDPELLASETVTVIVQVNGKLRDRVEAAADATEEELLGLARESEKVRAHVDGKNVVKEIVVPGKLVNLVVSN
jgi:leucyl-tRNA synthetase